MNSGRAPRDAEVGYVHISFRMDFSDYAAQLPARRKRAIDILKKTQLYVLISIGTGDWSAARVILVPRPHLAVRAYLTRRLRVAKRGVKGERTVLAHVIQFQLIDFQPKRLFRGLPRHKLEQRPIGYDLSDGQSLPRHAGRKRQYAGSLAILSFGRNLDVQADDLHLIHAPTERQKAPIASSNCDRPGG